MKNPHHGRPDYEKTTGNNKNCRHPFRPDTPFYSRKTPKLAKISNRALTMSIYGFLLNPESLDF